MLTSGATNRECKCNTSPPPYLRYPNHPLASGSLAAKAPDLRRRLCAGGIGFWPVGDADGRKHCAARARAGTQAPTLFGFCIRGGGGGRGGTVIRGALIRGGSGAAGLGLIT